jgi:hypothetical protein
MATHVLVNLPNGKIFALCYEIQQLGKRPGRRTLLARDLTMLPPDL